MSKVRSRVAIAVALAVSAPAAFADIGGPPATSADPWLRVNDGSDLLPPTATPNPDHSFTYDSGFVLPGDYSMQWTLNVNPDPFLNGTLTITNLSSNAKDFAVNLGLPVVPGFGPASRMEGSLAVDLADANHNGSATIQPVGSISNPLYRSQIDHSTVLQLFAFSMNCSGTDCTVSGSDRDGTPGLTLIGPGVVNSIGTLIDFNLSAGDSVTFHTHFEVVPGPVPLPATLPLLLSGLASLRMFRRRAGKG